MNGKMNQTNLIKNLRNKFGTHLFAQNIFKLLVENSSETFFVGGSVRDSLLDQAITDVDIATAASPQIVAQLLANASVRFDSDNSRYGVVVAKQGTQTIEIATFRKEVYGTSRYPKVSFITNVHTDSLRRDFTINALYFNPKEGILHDFHGGLHDIKTGQIKFIGDGKQKIMEDPLRIVRAVRFAILLEGFKLDPATQRSIKKCLPLLKSISKNRMQSEFRKIKLKRKKDLLEKIINKQLLDRKIFFAL